MPRRSERINKKRKTRGEDTVEDLHLSTGSQAKRFERTEIEEEEIKALQEESRQLKEYEERCTEFLKQRKPKWQDETIPSESRILLLPRELRDKIYEYLFRNTRLTFGERFDHMYRNNIRRINMKPAPNSLALLRVCRQINEETEASCLSRVLFSFECVEALLDKLSVLPSSKLCQIQQLRVRSHPLDLPVEGTMYTNYSIAWPLNWLSGLRLETLTVLGSIGNFCEYLTIRELAVYGKGWKELRYITKDSTILRHVQEHCAFERLTSQHSNWNEELLGRDGADSKSSVTIYRAEQDKSPGVAFSSDNSRLYEQHVAPPDTTETFGTGVDRQHLNPAEEKRELMVVVKRGQGVNVAEPETGRYQSHAIRLSYGNMTWQDIKAKYVGSDTKYHKSAHIYNYGYNVMKVSEEEYERKYMQVEEDTYEHVDDYVWPKRTQSLYSSRE